MKQNLSILYITPYVPSRVRVRPFALIRELAQLGHKVTLICLVQPAWEAAYLSEVAGYCQSIYPIFLDRAESYANTLSSVPTRVPLSVAYCQSDELNRLIRNLVRKVRFDIIHSEFIRTIPAVIPLGQHPKVFDAVDSLTLAYSRSMTAAQMGLPRRTIALLEWVKMRGYETWAHQFFDRVIVSSPVDAASFHQSNSASQAVVLPNGVDVDYFTPGDDEKDANNIVFLGKMSYYVNVSSVLWFYQQVFPLIQARRPGIKFTIVGRDPAPAIQALAAGPAVEVTHTVPDVRPYIRRAAVAVCPLVSGSGIQNKALEAMAVGTACVTTTMVADALQARPEVDFLTADSAETFAAQVLRLLDDPGLSAEVGRNGREYVETFHNWRNIVNNLDKMYQDLVR